MGARAMSRLAIPTRIFKNTPKAVGSASSTMTMKSIGVLGDEICVELN
jgi:hypothetical protein